MLRQRDGGADGVSRWSELALARRGVASDRQPGFMSRVKSFQGWGLESSQQQFGTPCYRLRSAETTPPSADQGLMWFLIYTLYLSEKDFKLLLHNNSFKKSQNIVTKIDTPTKQQKRKSLQDTKIPKRKSFSYFVYL